MEIKPADSTPSRPAPGEYFTGVVWQEPICDPGETKALTALTVTFSPGARTHWHTDLPPGNWAIQNESLFS